jgi:hypothetical protein
MRKIREVLRLTFAEGLSRRLAVRPAKTGALGPADRGLGIDSSSNVCWDCSREHAYPAPGATAASSPGCSKTSERRSDSIGMTVRIASESAVRDLVRVVLYGDDLPCTPMPRIRARGRIPSHAKESAGIWNQAASARPEQRDVDDLPASQRLRTALTDPRRPGEAHVTSVVEAV